MRAGARAGRPIVVTPLTIAAYALLIPALGARGAALAKTLSYAATFALTLRFYRRTTGSARIVQFIPTRSELADLWAVGSQIREWLTTMWRRHVVRSI